MAVTYNELPLRERNRQRTKQRLIASALELFFRQGYGSTTMDEIAELAEVSRATLFNYFPTKGSLFLPFATEIFVTRIQPELTEYLSRSPSAIEALRFFFMNIQSELLAVSGIEQALKEEFLRPKAFAPESLSDDMGFLNCLTEILTYGRERGEVRFDMPAEALGRFIGALYFSVFYTVIVQVEVTDYLVEIDRLLSFIHTGIQTSN